MVFELNKDMRLGRNDILVENMHAVKGDVKQRVGVLRLYIKCLIYKIMLSMKIYFALSMKIGFRKYKFNKKKISLLLQNKIKLLPLAV